LVWQRRETAAQCQGNPRDCTEMGWEQPSPGSETIRSLLGLRGAKSDQTSREPFFGMSGTYANPETSKRMSCEKDTPKF
jgi:hypothetical protein